MAVMRLRNACPIASAGCSRNARLIGNQFAVVHLRAAALRPSPMTSVFMFAMKSASSGIQASVNRCEPYSAVSENHQVHFV